MARECEICEGQGSKPKWGQEDLVAPEREKCGYCLGTGKHNERPIRRHSQSHYRRQEDA